MPNVVIATLESHHLVALARIPLVGERVHLPGLVHEVRVRVVVHTPYADECAAVVYVVECADEPSERLRARTRRIVEAVRNAEVNTRPPKDLRR